MDAAEAAGPGLTDRLIDAVDRLTVDPLPDEVLIVARHSLLDWIGLIVAGAGEPLVRMLVAQAAAEGGHAQATVLADGTRNSTALAALVNGAASDAIDYSTSHLAMRGHPGNAVIAAALAEAEARAAPAGTFLAAVVAGVELECRLGRLLFPAYMGSGFHPTGTIAPFGAALAAARVAGLDRKQTRDALNIVASTAAGLLANGGSMAKPLHSGLAAMNGVRAAALAGRGFTAHADAIGAAQGFIDTHLRRLEPEAAAAALAAEDGRFLILDTLFKTHAACTLTHSSIDNMLKLRTEHGVAPAEIAAVTLAVPATHLKVCNIEEPRTGLEAKFSLKATAAMALLGDDMAAMASYSDARATSRELAGLAGRIAVDPRSDVTNYVSHAEATLADGRTISVTSDTGEPIRELNRQRDIVATKFMGLVAPAIGGKAAERLKDAVLEIGGPGGVMPLIEAARCEPTTLSRHGRA
jgi:2-methylcitrate dehydratase PrpD